MKFRMIIILALLTIPCTAWAQDSLQQEKPITIRDIPSKIKNEYPLYIFKFNDRTCLNEGKKSTFRKFNIDWVQSIDIIKGKEATEKYGVLGGFGVVVITMKNRTYDLLPRKLKRRCK